MKVQSARPQSWTESVPQLHGPTIPAAVVEALPEFLKQRVLDTSLWKVALSVAALVVAATGSSEHPAAIRTKAITANRYVLGVIT